MKNESSSVNTVLLTLIVVAILAGIAIYAGVLPTSSPESAEINVTLPEGTGVGE